MVNIPKETGSGIASPDIALDWWAILGTAFAALALVATLCWVFPSDGLAVGEHSGRAGGATADLLNFLDVYPMENR